VAHHRSNIVYRLRVVQKLCFFWTTFGTVLEQFWNSFEEDQEGLVFSLVTFVLAPALWLGLFPFSVLLPVGAFPLLTPSTFSHRLINESDVSTILPVMQ